MEIVSLRLFFTSFLVLAAAVLVYGMLIEPNRIVVRQVEVPSPALGQFFGDAHVVHLSDLQIRGIGRREKKLIRLLEEIDPDYVFVTGDFSQKNGDYQAALELLDRIPAREGIWGVLGNTDYNRQRMYCALCHTDESYIDLRGSDPITMLRNDVVHLERNGRRLELIGLDEYDGHDGYKDAYSPTRVLDSACDDFPKLVLAHTPFCVDYAERRRVNLFLAGDTHGGQVVLPDPILQFVMPDKQMKYRTGLFNVGALFLHVNPGIGWNNLPIRIGCPPEITVLNFVGES